MIHGETRVIDFDLQAQISDEQQLSLPSVAADYFELMKIYRHLPTVFINKKVQKDAEFRKVQSIDWLQMGLFVADWCIHLSKISFFVLALLI